MVTDDEIKRKISTVEKPKIRDPSYSSEKVRKPFLKAKRSSPESPWGTFWGQGKEQPLLIVAKHHFV